MGGCVEFVENLRGINMADPVNYSIDDLRREIGILYFECRMRAEREDALKARIAQLEEELAALKE